MAKSDVRPRKLDIFTLKHGVSDFWWPMLIFEITKTNTPLPQKGIAPILIAPPHTYVRKPGNDSSVKQSKTNVTHRSRRNKATSASNRTPSRSLSSLQCWKDDPIFTRVLHLASAVYQCIQTLAGAAQRNTTTVTSGVDTVYKPSFFPLLFFYPPSLSFCRRSTRLMSVMCTDEHSLLHIMSRHAPYCCLLLHNGSLNYIVSTLYYNERIPDLAELST